MVHVGSSGKGSLFAQERSVLLYRDRLLSYNAFKYVHLSLEFEDLDPCFGSFELSSQDIILGHGRDRRLAAASC